MQSKDKVSARTRVFSISELFQALVQYLEPESIHTLRLLNKGFLELCTPHFFVTLHTANKNRYSDLKELFDLATTTDATTNKDPFDLIQGLILQGGQSDFSMILPQGMEAVLNRCRNLRSIKCFDARLTYLNAPDSPSPNRARLIWSKMQLQFKRPPQRLFFRIFYSSRPQVPTSSFWEQLPLEGSLLSRLESLTLIVGSLTPKKLDELFVRLRRSCVSKVLRSLTIEGDFPWDRQNKRVSLEVLLDCFYCLISLEDLNIGGIMIEPSEGSQQPASLTQVPCEYWVRSHPSPVKTFELRGSYTPETVQAILGCLPNIESLTLQGEFLNPLMALLAKKLETLSVPSMANINDDASLMLFPSLKRLNIPPTNVKPWVAAQVLNPLARQSSTGFQLYSLVFADQSYCPEQTTTTEVMQMVSDLSQELVSVQHLSILQMKGSYHPELTGCILTSLLCRNLVSLNINAQNLIGIKSYLWNEVPVDLGDVHCALPWAETLTKLVIRGSIDARLRPVPDSEHHRGIMSRQPPDQMYTEYLMMTKNLLKSMPRLEDLEIVSPMMDLELFNGLGREPQEALSTRTTMTQLPARGTTTKVAPMTQHRLTEIERRPPLRRLRIQKSYLAKNSLVPAKWGTLQDRFPFLVDSRVTFERDPFLPVPHDNGDSGGGGC